MTRIEAKILIAETLRELGVISGEISERQARKTATRHYRVVDIFDWQNKCYEPATLKTTTTKR